MSSENYNIDDFSDSLADFESALSSLGDYSDSLSCVQTVIEKAGVNGAVEDSVNANLELFYSKLIEFGYNLDEQKAVMQCEDSQLIISGAGSGKTTGLTFKIIHDLLSGTALSMKTFSNGVSNYQRVTQDPILVCTFLKTGAMELKANFEAQVRKLGLTGIDTSAIKFSTIHAEVLDLLNSLGLKITIESETSGLLRSLMNKYGIRSKTSVSRALTSDEVSDMSTVVSYTRNRLDDKRYKHPLLEDFGVNEVMFEAFMNEYLAMRQNLPANDFEDLQEMLYNALQVNPNIVEIVKNRYKMIYVDEFQDISQLQYAILKYYFDGAKRVLVIGDDDQSIYSWRGGDINIITSQFEQDYSPVVNKLTTNYRCKQNILAPVIPSIELNGKRHPKELKAYKQGGSVDVIYDGDVNLLLEKVKTDMANNMSVGIISRTNNDLLMIAMLLELDQTVNFSLSKSVSLTSKLPREIFGMMDLLLVRYSSEFESYFKRFLGRYDQHEADKLCSALKKDKSCNIYNIPDSDLSYSIPKLYPFISSLRRIRTESGDVMGYLYILTMLEQNVYTANTVYAQRAREFIYFIKKLIIEHKTIKELNLRDLSTLFTVTLVDSLNKRIRYGNGNYLRATTAHDAKGKEWDSVYIWNDVDGCFPNVVGNRELTQDELEEERRLHYIAWTRPKEKLCVFTRSKNPSPFIAECNLELQGVETSESSSVGDMNLVKRKEKKPAPILAPSKKDRDLLVDYIAETLESGSILDSNVANLEIVLNHVNNDTDALMLRLKDSGFEFSDFSDDSERKEAITNTIGLIADNIFSESGAY